MSAFLDEETVKREKTFAGETIIADPVAAVLVDHSLQAVQSPRLQVHTETSSLKTTQLRVWQNTIIVHVADFEYSC